MPRHSSWLNKKTNKVITNPKWEHLVKPMLESAPLGFINCTYWNPILSQYMSCPTIKSLYYSLSLLPLNNNSYTLIHLYYSGYSPKNISRMTNQERMNVTRRIRHAKNSMVKLLEKKEKERLNQEVMLFED